MKIRLLNDSGYRGIKNITFPVNVSAYKDADFPHLAFVALKDMLLIGYKKEMINIADDEEDFPFVIGEDCEVIND